MAAVVVESRLSTSDMGDIISTVQDVIENMIRLPRGRELIGRMTQMVIGLLWMFDIETRRWEMTIRSRIITALVISVLVPLIHYKMDDIVRLMFPELRTECQVRLGGDGIPCRWWGEQLTIFEGEGGR